MSILEKLKVKPVPKKIEQIKIKIAEPMIEEKVEIQTKIIDKTKENLINRDEFIKKLNTTVVDKNTVYYDRQLAVQYNEVLNKKSIFLQPTFHSHRKNLNLYSHSTISLSKQLSSKKFVFKKNEIIDISFFSNK